MSNTAPSNPTPNPSTEDIIRQAAAALSGLPVLEDESVQRQQDAFDRANLSVNNQPEQEAQSPTDPCRTLVGLFKTRTNESSEEFAQRVTQAIKSKIPQQPSPSNQSTH